MKNLFTLRLMDSLLKKELLIEKEKYNSFISSEETLKTVMALDGVDFKEFVINNDDYKKDNQIYKIDNPEERKKNKEKFVLIADGLILPFSVKKEIVKPTPKDENYESLFNKYNKYSPKTKTEIIDYIYSQNKDIVTKKFLKSNSIETVVEKLNYEKRDTLENFLLFYEIEKKTTLKSKKIPIQKQDELLGESNFFTEFNKIKNSDKRTIKKLYAYNKLKSKVTDEIDNLDVDKIKVHINENSSEFFTVVESQIFVQREDNIPENTDTLDIFFNREFDMSQYKKNIYRGKESEYNESITSQMQKPCENINEFLYNEQIQNFIQMQRDVVDNYQENEQIKMI